LWGSPADLHLSQPSHVPLLLRSLVYGLLIKIDESKLVLSTLHGNLYVEYASGHQAVLLIGYMLCLHCTSLCPAVDEQMEGMRMNEHIGELSKQAGVLSKQAASNLKKGFASLAASAKELSAKAQGQIKRGGGSEQL
jgi:hypothetical protein